FYRESLNSDLGGRPTVSPSSEFLLQGAFAPHPSSLPFSSSSSTSHSSNPSSSFLSTTSISMLTQAGPSAVPVTPYAFVPLSSPSSEPPVPCVYPASSLKYPPPVESPALVPEFAQAWTNAHKKAKAKAPRSESRFPQRFDFVVSLIAQSSRGGHFGVLFMSPLFPLVLFTSPPT
ncbi:hypothetical protein BC826DRAFT_1132171, partial [Russula brevipes]